MDKYADFSGKSGKKNLAVLFSGSGTTLNNICRHCYDQNGILYGIAQVTIAISNRKNAPGLEIAKKWGVIPYVIPSKSYFPDRWANSIYQIFNVTPKIHLAVMGGFLAHLPIREGFENKILNIHPSLLPKFGGKNMHGANVHREVLKAKEKVTGCTVHVVDEIYDHGPILAQQEVPILSEDTFETLQERVQEEERRLYPKVIKEYLQKIYP